MVGCKPTRPSKQKLVFAQMVGCKPTRPSKQKLVFAQGGERKKEQPTTTNDVIHLRVSGKNDG
jgi:hypothetical protein